MRLIILPAALAAAFVFYLLCPQTEGALLTPLHALYQQMRRLCRPKDGGTDESLALFMYLFVLCLVFSLLGAIHPLVCALLLVPTFSAPAIIRSAGQEKRDLDAGVYANNIPVYEQHVRDACQPLGPVFALNLCAPLLLAALGMPFYIGCGLAWAFLGLQAAAPDYHLAARIGSTITRAADSVLAGLFLLSCGLLGRNPLRTCGRGSRQRLMSILGIGQDGSDTHAPVAGDISQAVFLCCFCVSVLCLILTLLLIPVV